MSRRNRNNRTRLARINAKSRREIERQQNNSPFNRPANPVLIDAKANQERCKVFHETVVPLSKPVRRNLLRRALGLFIW